MTPTQQIITPLASERIALNPLTIESVDDDYLTWLTDPAIIEHIDARYTEQTIDSIKTFVTGFDQTNNLIWRISEKTTSLPIGNIQARINWLHKVADIGILIGNRNFWGIGIGSEALIRVIHFLLKELNLSKVTMATRATNTRMLKTIRALGFTEEGRLINHVRHEDNRCDIVQFGLLHMVEPTSQPRGNNEKSG